MLNAALLFLVMVVAGYLFRRWGVVRAEASRDLNRLVLYLTLPPLIFLALRRTPLAWSHALLPVLAWLSILAGVAVAWGVARLWRLSASQRAALALLMAFGNTTFLGYPLVSAVYGEAHLGRAIFFDQLGTWIAVNTVGVMLAGSASGHKVGLREALRTLLGFPPFWALVAGLIFHDVALPSGLEQVLQRIADLTVPLIMFAMGMSLRGGAWRHEARLVMLASGVRLLLLPLGVYLLARGWAMPRMDVQASVFEAAMPGMFYSWTLALVYGLDETLVVNGIMASTFLSALSLPLWVAILGLG